MSFLSVEFAIIFSLVLVFSFIFKEDTRKRQWVILIASICIYAMWNISLCLVLFAVIGIAYISVQRRGFIKGGLILCVSILLFYKYCNQIFTLVAQANGKSEVVALMFPLGLSFYIFKAISYIADVWNEKLEKKDLFDVALYISFFPQIISGPIEKAREFFGRGYNEHRKINRFDILVGTQMFLVGVLKKRVLADRLAVCVDTVYAAPMAYSSWSVILAVISYALQLYLDFSGYSDMSIGICKILGYDVKPNFNMPYLSHNPTEFWKRWHISLSEWLMEYVYIPLGGSRCKKWKKYINLILTMMIGGIWHGATWNFLLWGGYHGIGLVVHKVWMDVKKKYGSGCMRWITNLWSGLSIALTFMFSAVGWVFFRVQSLTQIKNILWKCINFSDGIHYNYVYSYLTIIICVLISIVAYFKNSGNGFMMKLQLNKAGGLFLFLMMLFGVMIFTFDGNNVFIYANF